MCLRVSEKAKPILATEDIYTIKRLKVYKGPDNTYTYHSPIHKKEWKLGENQKRISICKNHTYWGYVVRRGYFSYDISKFFPGNLNEKEFFLCKIPKGTEYIQDEDNAEVSSSQLIIIEHIYSHEGYKHLKHHNVSRMSYRQRFYQLKKYIESLGVNTKFQE